MSQRSTWRLVGAGFALFAALTGTGVKAETLAISLSVLDTETFETRLPLGRVNWLIRSLAGEERRGDAPAASDIELETGAGRYTVIVWESESEAASRIEVMIEEGATRAVSALLSAQNAALIPPEPAPETAPPATSAPAADIAATAQTPTSEIVSEEAEEDPAVPASLLPPTDLLPRMSLEIMYTLAPGAAFSVRLPAVESWEDDLVVIVGGGPGRRATIVRGAAGALDLVEPEAPGRYRVEYLDQPEGEIIASTEFTVE